MTSTKYIIGVLTIIIIATAFYVTFQNDLKIRVDDDKSTFYVKNENNRWVVAGREYNYLFDGTSKMYRRGSGISREIIVNNISNTTTITRNTRYIRGPFIKDTYFFNGSMDDEEMFPVYHKVEIFNASGKFYRYEVRDLEYDRKTKKLYNKTYMSFGKNMKVEWQDDYRWSWVYKTGILKTQYDISSDYEVFSVKLFDPIICDENTTHYYCIDGEIDLYLINTTKKVLLQNVTINGTPAGSGSDGNLTINTNNTIEIYNSTLKSIGRNGNSGSDCDDNGDSGGYGYIYINGSELSIINSVLNGSGGNGGDGGNCHKNFCSNAAGGNGGDGGKGNITITIFGDVNTINLSSDTSAGDGGDGGDASCGDGSTYCECNAYGGDGGDGNYGNMNYSGNDIIFNDNIINSYGGGKGSGGSASYNCYYNDLCNAYSGNNGANGGNIINTIADTILEIKNTNITVWSSRSDNSKIKGSKIIFNNSILPKTVRFGKSSSEVTITADTEVTIYDNNTLRGESPISNYGIINLTNSVLNKFGMFGNSDVADRFYLYCNADNNFYGNDSSLDSEVDTTNCADITYVSESEYDTVDESYTIIWHTNISNTSLSEDFGIITYLDNITDYISSNDSTVTADLNISEENESQVNCTLYNNTMIQEDATSFSISTVDAGIVDNYKYFDNDTTTYAYCSPTGSNPSCSWIIKYNKTLNSYGVSWNVTDDCTDSNTNYTIPSNCWNYNDTEVELLHTIDISGSGIHLYACKNSSGWNTLETKSSGCSNKTYEEHIVWDKENNRLNLSSTTNWYGNASCNIQIQNSIADDGINNNFTIEVTPVNDAPTFDEDLTNQSINSTNIFVYDINCSDIDGDAITYSTNTSWISINSSNGFINTTSSALETYVGNNSINTTCSDDMLSTSQIFILEINDTTLPSISLYSPSDSSRSIGNYTELSYEPYDNGGFGNCTLIFNGTVNTTDTSITNNDYNYFYMNLSYGETYNWTVNCTDQAGNTNSTNVWNFTINTPPNASELLSPSNNSVFGGDSIELQWNTNVGDDDGDSLQFYLFFDNKTSPDFYTSQDNNTDTVRVNIPDEGTYYWYVKTFDSYEFSEATDIWQFNKTGDAPNLTKQLPTQTSQNETNATFRVNIQTDNLNLSSVKISIDGSFYTMTSYTNNSGSNYTFTRKVNSLSKGNKSYYFVAEDINGVQGVSPIYYLYIDLSYPVVTLVDPTPSNGTFWNTTLNGTNFTLNFTVTEPLLDTLFLNWKILKNGEINNNGTIYYNTTIRKDEISVSNSSHYKGKVCAIDIFNRQNCSEERDLFIYPNNVPLFITNISNYTTYENIDISNALDLNDYFIDPEEWKLTFDSYNGSDVWATIYDNGSIDINVSNGFTGNGWIIFNATDPEGKSIESNNITVFVLEPYITFSNIVEQTDPTTYEKMFNLTVDIVTDAGDVDTVLVETNWSSVLTNHTATLKSGNTYNYTFNTTMFGTGILYYRWIANNSYQNENKTGWYNITINKMTPIIKLWLDDSENNLTVYSTKNVSINSTLNCHYCNNITIYNTTDLLCNQETPLNCTYETVFVKGENETIIANMSGNENYTAVDINYTIFYITNLPPEWSSIPNQTVFKGFTYTINLSQYISDPESDDINYSVVGENLSQINCDVNITTGNLTFFSMIDNDSIWYGDGNCIIQAKDNNTNTINTTVNINVNSTGFTLLGNYTNSKALFWNITNIINKDINFSCIAYDTYDFSWWYYE